VKGELVYLSERKLRTTARGLGIGGRRVSKTLAVEGSARVSLPLPPVAEVAAQATARAELVEDDRRERIIERTLAKVVRALRREGLPELDGGAAEIRAGGWFRFHRDLRFGIGSTDSNEAVQALILVDRKPVEGDGGVPGLLMHGAFKHALAPYRPEEPDAAPGVSSGSASGALFTWAQQVSRALGEDPPKELDALEAAAFDQRRDEAEAAVEMYRLFAREDRMARLPQLANVAPCEGVARATFVASSGASTVVMGSPLYVRVQPLPGPEGGELTPLEGARRRGLLERVLRRPR
jgi:hypothetical protein